MTKKYLSGKEASEILGVHQRTLYLWDEKGKIETIRTPGNKRLYNVEKFLKELECENDNDCIEKVEKAEKKKGKLKLSYARVSSYSQKDDLERQKKEIKRKYPNHIMIEDIGSGINLNKRGIRKIIDLAIGGRISELVVSYKDRLSRFGYELIEDLVNKYSEGKIIVINKKEEITKEEELVQDVMQLMNVFVSKMNGIRKYNKNQ